MENNPKSQVVERLREAQNILVTVSANPSVDQLAAAIGLTLMLNKLGKHATAVFSGAVPSTLEFLKPEATLEQNTNSLRDFIIALDKAKADKLRYKVEDDFVKIFITPYRTSLSEADLNFSQGDFNVDAVMALGVDQRDHIDQAILAHGRILHDATVIGVMAGEGQVDLGSINWQDPAASSLCEMLVSISEAFQSGILDTQMATAFLTGIVAETERFSNQKTSPKVMTMSAQLMAAGANQQLIATQLAAEPEAPIDLPAPIEDDEPVDEAVLELDHDEDEIRIDEHGEMSSADELAKAVTEVQEGPKPEISGVQSSTSKFITEPPTSGGTLTANSIPEDNEPNIDPLAAPAPGTEQPIVGTHGRDIRPLSDNASTQSPLISVSDDAESVPAPSVNSSTDPLLSSDGETKVPEPDLNADIPIAPENEETSLPVIDKLGPEVKEADTLADIEHAVEDFTGAAPHAAEPSQPESTPEPEQLSADAARQAVMDAMASSGGFDPERPEPLQSMGAQEFPATESAPEVPEASIIAPDPVADMPQVPDMPLFAGQSPPELSSVPELPIAPEQSVDAPPSVPPPMMPQFPIPGADVYEPDQDSQNPPAAA